MFQQAKMWMGAKFAGFENNGPDRRTFSRVFQPCNLVRHCRGEAFDRFDIFSRPAPNIWATAPPARRHLVRERTTLLVLRILHSDDCVLSLNFVKLLS